METMTLLKWQLQQPARNDDGTKPRSDNLTTNTSSYHYEEDPDTIIINNNNNNNNNKNNNNNNSSSNRVSSRNKYKINKNIQINYNNISRYHRCNVDNIVNNNNNNDNPSLSSKLFTKSPSKKLYDIEDTSENNNMVDSHLEEKSESNSPSPPNANSLTSSPFYPNTKSTMAKSYTSENSSSMFIKNHSPIHNNIIDPSNTSDYKDLIDTKLKFPRFSFYSNQALNKDEFIPSSATNHNYMMAQQEDLLSKSYPPYHEYKRSSPPERKFTSSSPTSSPPGSSSLLLSPPLSSSISSLSSSFSSPAMPFRLFSMQPSSLFPVSFPIASSTIPHPLENDDHHHDSSKDPQSQSPTNSSLPPSPQSPQQQTSNSNFHHILPPSYSHHALLNSSSLPTPQPKFEFEKEEVNNYCFLSRKRRHSTAPILVDTNIPFTTYLQNLTKTLQASARSKSTTVYTTNDPPSPPSCSETSVVPNRETSCSKQQQEEPDSSSSYAKKIKCPSLQTFHGNNHYYQNVNNDEGDENSDDDGEVDVTAPQSCSPNNDNDECMHDNGDWKKDSNDDEGNDRNVESDDDDEKFHSDTIRKIHCNNDDNNECVENEINPIKQEYQYFDNDERSINQDEKPGEKLYYSKSKNRILRRDRRIKRYRHTSELFIKLDDHQKDSNSNSNEEEEEEREEREATSSRHPLSAPVFAGVTAPIVFPNPVSLYPTFHSLPAAREDSMAGGGTTQHRLDHLHQLHRHQQQQHQQLQQLQQQQQQHHHHLPRHPHLPHHPHPHPHPHPSHPLSMALSAIPLHATTSSQQRSPPPPLLQSQLTPPGPHFSPSHIYNKLFPGLASSSSSFHQSRLTDLHAAGRGSIPGPTTPGTTSSFFTSQFLGLGGLGMRRTSSDKPPPVKKYKCDVCQKAFSRSNTLVTHKRIHTGDKPFKCEICGRAFRQPGNLTRHRLTHTTHKPYVCHVCGKAFNRASNLNTHIRTHNSFRQFGCAVCPTKTSYLPKAEFVGDRSLKCDICGRCFAHTTTLLAHRRTHEVM